MNLEEKSTCATKGGSVKKKERGGGLVASLITPPRTTIMTPHYIAIDTETGGTRPGCHALLSIAAIADWAPDMPEVIYVTPESQPGKTIDPEAARKNGYTPERWAQRGAVDLKTAMIYLSTFLQDRFTAQPAALMLAHNAGFDRMILDEASAITGVRMPIRHAWRCSMDMLGRLMDRGLIPSGRANLDRLGELSGQWPVGQRPEIHEAAGDALACLRGYQWLLEKERAPEADLRAEIDALRAEMSAEKAAATEKREGPP